MIKFRRLLRALLGCLGILSSFILVNVFAEEEALLNLQKQLQKVIFHVDPAADIGIKVLSLKDGKMLFEKNSDKKFIPAGILKLMTAGAVLDILGPGYCFETKILSNGIIEDGVLKGNVYLEGSGDPSLSTSCLDDLVFQLKLMNINTIEGDVVLDTSEFDELTLAPGWMWDEKLEYRDAPVNALTINHSCVNVWVRPSHLVNVSPSVQIYPEIPGIIIENEATTASIPAKEGSLKVRKKEIPDKDIIYISGLMSLKAEMQNFKIPVKNPQLYVAAEFCEKLKQNKIKINGKVRFDLVPLKYDVIATHLSEPAFKLVAYMLKNADNLYANCFLKKIGRIKFGKPGTWPNGAQAVRDFLIQINPTTYSDLVILDGSGESRYNKLSSHQIVTFLQWMTNKFSYSPELLASMPLAGVDSVFKKRLREKKFHAKVRALTGTLQGVSSLCGFITTIDNETLAFSIISNGFIKENKEIKSEIEDEVCHILSNFSRRH